MASRTVRLTLALGTAVLLAGALLYTSFASSSEAREPSQLRSDVEPGKSYRLTGEVVEGSVRQEGETLLFRVRDRKGSTATAVPVRYTGSVPDPFREGREVIVTVSQQGTTFVGRRDSLITKCPSKFDERPPGSAQPGRDAPGGTAGRGV